MNYQALVNQAANFIGKWLAVAVVVYFGWNKLAPWIDSFVPF